MIPNLLFCAIMLTISIVLHRHFKVNEFNYKQQISNVNEMIQHKLLALF